MRYPQIIIREADGWIARQLRAVAEEHRWLIREPRKDAEALAGLHPHRPALLIVQVDPSREHEGGWELMVQAHELSPQTPILVVSDSKLPDAERVAWTAALMDLGAWYVLFPPLAASVIEDVTVGLMLTVLGQPMASAEQEPHDSA